MDQLFSKLFGSGRDEKGQGVQGAGEGVDESDCEIAM